MTYETFIAVMLAVSIVVDLAACALVLWQELRE